MLLIRIYRHTAAGVKCLKLKRQTANPSSFALDDPPMGFLGGLVTREFREMTDSKGELSILITTVD